MANGRKQLTTKKSGAFQKRSHPEADIQVACVNYLTMLERMNVLRFHATPNGGSRHVIEAANLKRQGVKAGVPDICVMLAYGPTLWFELKAPKGKPTHQQLDFIAWANTHGHPAWIVRGVDEMDGILRGYMGKARAA